MGDVKDEARGNAPPFPSAFTPTPRAPRGSGSNWPFGVTGLLVVLGIGAAIWYFGVYDTAEGKCNRGDLGACLVVYAKQSAEASASAAVAYASASAAAAEVSASAAAVAASVEASSFAASGCTVGPADGSHNVRITVSDTASANVQRDACEQLVQAGWVVASNVDGATQVCQVVAQDGNTITVTDTGGQYYGQQDCQAINAGNLPRWGN